jgi:pyrroline-5-carboxylate reductase
MTSSVRDMANLDGFRGGQVVADIRPSAGRRQHLRPARRFGMISTSTDMQPRDQIGMTGRNDLRIAFLGAGKMATALARGWIAAGLLSPENCRGSDPVAAAREGFAAETGGACGCDNREVVESSAVLLLAVKPQNMAELLAEIAPVVTGQHLVISIAAGITLDRIAAALGANRRIVRVMPNTPCLVGASASAYALGKGVGPDDVSVVERLLNVVGVAFRLPEHLLDAVTGLSGSGPAFVYAVIEALSDGGVRVGLPRDVSTTLAAQTVLGAARMLLETGLHPGVLKDQVASPGGTTIAGLHALERGGLRAALMDAVEAATKRSQELGRSDHG